MENNNEKKWSWWAIGIVMFLILASILGFIIGWYSKNVALFIIMIISFCALFELFGSVGP